MNILGLSGLAHDSAAALLSDSGILAAMEESKPQQPLEFLELARERGLRDAELLGVLRRQQRHRPALSHLKLDRRPNTLGMEYLGIDP